MDGQFQNNKVALHSWYTVQGFNHIVLLVLFPLAHLVPAWYGIALVSTHFLKVLANAESQSFIINEKHHNEISCVLIFTCSHVKN